MIVIMAGDTVKCCVGYYKSYGYGELAVVKRVELSPAGNPVLILENNLCDYGTSMYSIDNWQFHSRPQVKKEKPMGYLRTQYFAVKVTNNAEGGQFLPMVITESGPEYFNEMTTLRHSKAEVLKDIRSIIKDGESWVILQTQGVVTPAEPKPVLKDIVLVECR